MNYFSHDEETTILEDFPRSIGQVDGALDAVAEAELLRQANGGLTDGNDAASASNFVHDIAPVVRFDLLLHGRHDVGRTQIDLLARRGAAGNKIRAHGMAAPAPRGAIAAVLRSAS